MKSDRFKIKENVTKWNSRSASEDQRLTNLDSMGGNSWCYSECSLKLIFFWLVHQEVLQYSRHSRHGSDHYSVTQAGLELILLLPQHLSC